MARPTRPTQIPAQGWKQVLLRTKDQIKEDNVPLLAAGVAFYAFIALFPALIAAVTVYGLVADPEQVEEQIGGFARHAAERGGVAARRAADRHRGRLVERARLGPAAQPRRCAVRRQRRHAEPHQGRQHRLRRAGDPRLRQAARARAGAHARRDRLHRGRRSAWSPSCPCVLDGRRAGLRRPHRRAGRPAGPALVVFVLVALARRLPLRARPRRPEVPLGRPRQRRRDAAVDHRLGAASRSTSATSASTARPTARWPAS